VREPLAEGPGPSAEVQGPEHGAAEVAALLARTDLSAIVVSSDRAWALIDGRILKVGETLSPELARLIAIEPGGVVLETPVGRRRLELPPLRPAPRATGSDPAEDPSTDAPSAELEALELDGAA
jgi:hypothetical protein